MITYITAFRVDFTKEKNFSVEDIGSYLSNIELIGTDKLTLPSIPFEFKHELHKTLNIDITSDKNITMGSLSTFKYNYLRVFTTYDTPSQYVYYYYFIVGYKWKSQHCIELELEMDDLNTFAWIQDHSHTSVDYSIGERSVIQREHKDRWQLDENDQLSRKIDKISEGLNLIKYQTQDVKINKNEQCWYLMYRNKENIDPSAINQVNPVDVYVIPKELQPLTYTDVFLQSRERTSQFLRITTLQQQKVTFYFNDYSITLENESDFKRWIEVGNVNDDYIRVWESRRYDSTSWRNSIVKILTSTDYGGRGYVVNLITGTNARITSSAFSPSYTSPPELTPNTSISLTTHNTFINGVGTIDRTDSRLIKIVELPYSPLNIDNNIIKNVGFQWTSLGVLLNLDMIDAFKNNIEFTTDVIEELSDVIDDSEVEVLSSHLHEYKFLDYPKYESKLLHSDYCQEKFLYDSFSCEIINEFVDTAMMAWDYDDHIFSFDIIPSSAVSSNFMFDFEIPLKTSLTDYDNLMIVNRNNEVPLYTSQYINYIRNGYNYDVKNKDLQLSKGAFNIGASTITSALRGAFLSKGNLVGTGIGLVSGLVTGIDNQINLQASLENQIEAKINQSKSQAVAVSGSDDLSLMRVYTGGNKLHLLRYEVSEEMKELLLKKFHYFGYQANKIGVPDMTSRYWFNFAQGDIILKNPIHIPLDIQQDIVKKWSEGVTRLHKRLISNVATWDFAQEYINIENTILGGN